MTESQFCHSSRKDHVRWNLSRSYLAELSQWCVHIELTSRDCQSSSKKVLSFTVNTLRDLSLDCSFENKDTAKRDCRIGFRSVSFYSEHVIDETDRFLERRKFGKKTIEQGTWPFLVCLAMVIMVVLYQSKRLSSYSSYSSSWWSEEGYDEMIERMMISSH